LSWSTDDVSAISRMVPDFGASWRRYFGDASPDTAQAAQQARATACALVASAEPRISFSTLSGSTRHLPGSTADFLHNQFVSAVRAQVAEGNCVVRSLADGRWPCDYGVCV